MQNTKPGKVLAPLALLIVVASLVGYAVSHKPFEATELLSLLTALFRVGVAAIVILLAGGLGKKFRRRDEMSLSLAARDAGVGLGIMGLVVFLLGFTIGFNLWILLTPIVIGFILLRCEIASFARAWKEAGTFFKEMDLGIGLIAAFTLVILAANLIIALSPPTSFDGLTYHLTLPKYYLFEGRIDFVPELMYWGMPQLSEMAFTLAMKFGGAEAAATLQWMVGVVALTAIFSFVQQTLNKNSAWVAVASLLCGWTLSDALSRAYVEWSLVLYGALFLIQLNQWRATRSRADLIWSAIFAGFALSTKYMGGILVVAGIVVIFFDQFPVIARRAISPTKQSPLPRDGLLREKRPRNDGIKNAFLFGLIASLILSPWLIKNYLATGNPFYPILFPAGAMDATRLDFYEGTPIALTPIERILLPALASFRGLEGGAPFNASLGPLLFALSLTAPLAWTRLEPRQKQVATTALIVLVTGFVLWMVGSAATRLLIQPRLYLVFFPVWAILAAYGFFGLEGSNLPKFKISWLVSMLAAFSLGLNAYETGMDLLRRDALKFVTGQMDEGAYLAQSMGHFSPAMDSIRSLPRDSKVLLLWETRGYYCIPTCNPDETIDEFKDALVLHGSADSILVSWREQGYTHILLHNRGADFVREDDLLRYVPEDWIVFDALVASLKEIETFGAAYTLYELPHQP
ncbi:MAG: hypothetical protein HY867_20975 [Chloroflexi bacterium]|nr:hypothetical protein [Chloroflexota bacterium]